MNHNSAKSVSEGVAMIPSLKSMMKIVFLLSLALFISAFVAAQSSPLHSQTTNNVVAENRDIPRPAIPTKDDKSYRIGVGDLLDVRVLNHPEMSRKMRVEGSGMVRVPMAGDVVATCLTESQLSQIITEKFRKWIKEPYVDVFIEEYSSQPVAVIGAVDKPGRFQFQRRVRLIELLT